MIPEPHLVGRYAVFGPIATGGMATVCFARSLGRQGFDRVLAIKRLHPQFAADPDFVEMFLDEARLAARVRHLNVVSALDVVEEDGQVALILEYVSGETLMRLVRRAGTLGRPVPLEVVAAIGVGVLDGLHAAHEARSVEGVPLGIVHRDVSPHNVLVGADGIARLLDFGVAKAAQRSGATRDGHIKGKLSYMPPEQLSRAEVDRRSDVYSAAVTLWEALTGRRLFHGETQAIVLGKVLLGRVEPPSQYRRDVPPALESLLLESMRAEPDARPSTAYEMARRLEAAVAVATPQRVARWVEELCGDALAEQAAIAAAVERAPLTSLPLTGFASGNTGSGLLRPPSASPSGGTPSGGMPSGSLRALSGATPSGSPRAPSGGAPPWDASSSSGGLRFPAGGSSSGPLPSPVPPGLMVPGSLPSAPPLPSFTPSSGTYLQSVVSPRPPQPTGGLTAWGTGAALLLVGLSLGWWQWGRRAGDAVSSAPPPSASASASTPSAASAAASEGAAAASTGAAAHVGAPDAPGASASGAATAALPGKVLPVRGSKVRGPQGHGAKGEEPVPGAKPEPKPAPTADCQVPYRIDENGLRQLKPECL
jgi:serine/threonine-protein kinase